MEHDKHMSIVSIVKTSENTKDSVKKAINQSLNLIDYRWKHGIKNVVIKPNLCYYWDYSTGQTTDPKFVASIIELLRENVSPDVNISIIESDASAMVCKYAFKMLGYEKIAEKYNVKLVNLSKDPFNPAKVTVEGKIFQFTVPETIQRADLKINVPKIKYTVRGIELTCALKNIYGCNPHPKKFKYHKILAETIIALNKLMKFDLCIIDGNIVSGIAPRKLGLVMASQDPVAVDVVAAEIAGLNPKKIKYLQLAEKRGYRQNFLHTKRCSNKLF